MACDVVMACDYVCEICGPLDNDCEVFYMGDNVWRCHECALWQLRIQSNARLQAEGKNA